MTPIISIDPGATGGIAYTLDGKSFVAVAMPDTEGDILGLFRSIAVECGDTIPTVFLEKVGGFIGRPQPGSAMFKFGQNYGFVLGCCMGLAWRVELVTPQKWQKTLGLGTSNGDKAEWKRKLKAEAQRLYPSCQPTLKTADALLILEYGRRVAR